MQGSWLSALLRASTSPEQQHPGEVLFSFPRFTCGIVSQRVHEKPSPDKESLGSSHGRPLHDPCRNKEKVFMSISTNSQIEAGFGPSFLRCVLVRRALGSGWT